MKFDLSSGRVKLIQKTKKNKKKGKKRKWPNKLVNEKYTFRTIIQISLRLDDMWSITGVVIDDMINGQ